MIWPLPLAGKHRQNALAPRHRRFSTAHAATLDYAAIAAYVAEGQAELYGLPTPATHARRPWNNAALDQGLSNQQHLTHSCH